MACVYVKKTNCHDDKDDGDIDHDEYDDEYDDDGDFFSLLLLLLVVVHQRTFLTQHAC